MMIRSQLIVNRRRSVGNVITFNAAISACQKGGAWQEAARHLDKLFHPFSLSRFIPF